MPAYTTSPTPASRFNGSRAVAALVNRQTGINDGSLTRTSSLSVFGSNSRVHAVNAQCIEMSTHELRKLEIDSQALHRSTILQNVGCPLHYAMENLQFPSAVGYRETYDQGGVLAQCKV